LLKWSKFPGFADVDKQIAVSAEDNRAGIFAGNFDTVIICLTGYDSETKVPILGEMMQSLLADYDDERRWGVKGLSERFAEVGV
jgi:hypothetical protein